LSPTRQGRCHRSSLGRQMRRRSLGSAL